jgi:hypothetical protein
MITPNSITGMTGLPARPVYFVKLHGSPTPNLVVKGEAGGKYVTGMSNDDAVISIAWGSKLMKNVNSSLVNMKIMNPSEIQVFKAAAAAKLAPGSKQLLNTTEATPYNWVKMPYVAHISDASPEEEITKIGMSGTPITLMQWSAPKAIAAMQKMSNDALWMQLGQVVAVDIFNGNSDRFELETGTWTNFGNVMFHTVQGQPRVIGLDTFDPHAGARGNLNKRGVYDELRILIDISRRKEFAKACTESFGSTVAKAMRPQTDVRFRDDATGNITWAPVKALPKLFGAFADSFEQGLVTGAQALKTYLQAKTIMTGQLATRSPLAPAVPPRPAILGGTHRLPPPTAPTRPTTAPPKQIPQGILDRMRFLGWSV